MITGTWFLKHVRDKEELNNHALMGNISPEEYRELKKHCKHYLKDKHQVMYKLNKVMATHFFNLYQQVLKRMREIEK